ncbi:uncharacterized protein At5g43822-like isoform X2 [Durio zibethinus]|uniref:Uncharacterized protein At5g43822-like isoform X2 n=1 Tax=Durio zibethinus TaxID=66656 RepID=A0A6P5YEZ8_DURZI|nr:uncharacterized protein At5g43822-like isoform X2 [Durio zibethinus]
MEIAVLQSRWILCKPFLLSMKNTDGFCAVVLSLEKLQHDGKQLAKGSSYQMNRKQLQHRIGIRPFLTNCIDGLMLLHEMPLADSSDLGVIQQLLVDQPNMLNNEGRRMFLKSTTASLAGEPPTVVCWQGAPAEWITIIHFPWASKQGKKGSFIVIFLPFHSFPPC